MTFELIFTVLLYLTFGAFLVEDRKKAAGYPLPRWERVSIFLLAPVTLVCVMIFAVLEFLFILVWKNTRKWRTKRA